MLLNDLVRLLHHSNFFLLISLVDRFCSVGQVLPPHGGWCEIIQKWFMQSCIPTWSKFGVLEDSCLVLTSEEDRFHLRGTDLVQKCSCLPIRHFLKSPAANGWRQRAIRGQGWASCNISWHFKTFLCTVILDHCVFFLLTMYLFSVIYEYIYSTYINYTKKIEKMNVRFWNWFRIHLNVQWLHHSVLPALFHIHQPTHTIGLYYCDWQGIEYFIPPTQTAATILTAVKLHMLFSVNQTISRTEQHWNTLTTTEPGGCDLQKHKQNKQLKTTE